MLKKVDWISSDNFVNGKSGLSGYSLKIRLLCYPKDSRSVTYWKYALNKHNTEITVKLLCFIFCFRMMEW